MSKCALACTYPTAYPSEETAIYLEENAM